ncbi:contact-dependent growth inhibition system immunity protein [Leminorella grimontii]|uniref:contact-dependent growth inhibition system immunity protein n=1 Tax=Leminorella grimontii TaxID=82981 RepID=UPI00208ACF2C|nr:contact-dependent growth inhibition system immunity protein [Leminorella grimontii]GKX60081.1 hypothetical protein SOASR031_23960 [Leminorella grimontii]
MGQENINYLLSAYFHQDWRCDANSADEIIINFKNFESPKTVEKLRNEIDNLLLLNQEIGQNFIYENDGNYNPNTDGLSVTEWFKRILQLLTEP